MKTTLFSLFILVFSSVSAQEIIVDSAIYTITLQDVRITAFEHNRSLKDVPAAIGYVRNSTIQRFSPASIVQAVNTTPGVRMEERSPGSYRFNIRGSSLRSPFGVRNVKVYFNDIPYTDPGGTTFLNQLGNYNFNTIEIIKGPGSSLYGAGTGGVLLIQSMSNLETPSVQAEYSAGSYGFQNLHLGVTTASEKTLSRISFQRLESNGYRQQSALKKDVFDWTGQFNLNSGGVVKTTFIYGNHFYETPGALTLNEYNNNPTAARPGGGGFPGAIAAEASIRQKTFLAGASLDQPFSSWLRNKTVLYGMFTELRNPNLRAYEKSSLPHVGGRTVFEFNKTFSSSSLNIDLGAEYQEGFSSVDVHKNVSGNADSLRTSDEINNSQALAFVQATVDINNDWTIVAGTSMNWSRLNFTRYTPATVGMQKRNFGSLLAPRFALMKKFGVTSLYAAVSNGFSPPSTAELLPTGGAINLNLDPETGTNYELGFKGRLQNEFTFDVNAFLFGLSNTIVQRRDAGGGDYFINAGKTNQKGVELALTYPLLKYAFPATTLAWLSYTYHHFNYEEFKPLTSDFSGNALPGVAPHTLSAGYDVYFKNGLLSTVSYYFSDRLPLNDANSAYANAYHLLAAKLGFQKTINQKWRGRIVVGAENLLDQKYSLGNDINGFGGRYYNAAPRRNFYASLLIQMLAKKRV